MKLTILQGNKRENIKFEKINIQISCILFFFSWWDNNIMLDLCSLLSMLKCSQSSLKLYMEGIPKAVFLWTLWHGLIWKIILCEIKLKYQVNALKSNVVVKEYLLLRIINIASVNTNCFLELPKNWYKYFTLSQYQYFLVSRFMVQILAIRVSNNFYSNFFFSTKAISLH